MTKERNENKRAKVKKKKYTHTHTPTHTHTHTKKKLTAKGLQNLACDRAKLSKITICPLYIERNHVC